MTAAPPARLAAHVHRLAVLLAAGIAPASAWRHVAAEGDDETLDGVVAQLERAPDAALALERAAPAQDPAWAALLAAWRVAAASGAALAPALTAFAGAIRDRQEAARDIEIALAGPQATARIVLLLPVCAIVLALLLGVDLLGTLAQPLGFTSAVLGVGLLLLARRWMRRMLSAAAPPPPTAGLALDLLAVAAGGGGSPEAALALVTAELDRASLALDEVETAAAQSLVRLSRVSGAPLGALCRAEAVERRADARANARVGAERLAVRLMLPLGACILPSFVLLGVVPLLLGLLSSTPAS
ncbi:MAG: type II secretion system F family protein [Actinobacteria bacterium]|nr:type II secretion system F family protein [Actinomycetota bacterium]MBU1608975.1 type II secretion system F family protein [Actinomycetota bacterium]MBU2316416.1 type II secretion system F family protein [Actinomycetota bacterium]